MGKLLFGSKQGRSLMSKIKKSMIFVLYVLTAVLMSFSLFGCSDSESKKDEKYDVAIRIGCSDGNIYEFPIGTDEVHIEIPYDGTERTYWVDSYHLVDHPGLTGWSAPKGEGANVFQTSLEKVHQMYYEDSPEYVCEIGEYYFYVYADSTSYLWNSRIIYLYITVV